MEQGLFSWLFAQDTGDYLGLEASGSSFDSKLLEVDRSHCRNWSDEVYMVLSRARRQLVAPLESWRVHYKCYIVFERERSAATLISQT